MTPCLRLAGALVWGVIILFHRGPREGGRGLPSVIQLVMMILRLTPRPFDISQVLTPQSDTVFP